MRIRQKHIHFVVLILVCTLLVGFDHKQEVSLQGKTMGTTYHIKVVTSSVRDTEGLHAKIDRRLQAINQSMSTYMPASEISRFNAMDEVKADFPISADFFRVLTVAAKIHRVTEGAWDCTVMPLVNLWGFGPKGAAAGIPDARQIEQTLSDVGFQHIDIIPGSIIRKKKAGITLDLGSIAKGYGVDAVSETVRQAGFVNFLVEIGGEVYASGIRQDGQQWRVGINRPDPSSPHDQVYSSVPLEHMALATSGDYRNFIEFDGRRYAHVIDPRTGYPVSNGVVSVTIIADTCTLADGLATAVMVMGLEKGLDLVNALDGVEGLLVVRQDDDSLSNYYSLGLQPEATSQ